jgi:hypothetical protein
MGRKERRKLVSKKKNEIFYEDLFSKKGKKLLLTR